LFLLILSKNSQAHLVRDSASVCVRACMGSTLRAKHFTPHSVGGSCLRVLATRFFTLSLSLSLSPSFDENASLLVQA